MQPEAYPVQHERLHRIWHNFVETGRIDPDDEAWMDPAVLQSWRRCSPRLDFRARPNPSTLKLSSLSSILKAQADLIGVATPLMEDIHQFIEASNCAILLADPSACILQARGDDSALALIKESGLGRGTYWSEGQMGTNALAIARIDAVPVQIVGEEHYFRAHHHFATTAAPIHNVRGRIIGVLGAVSLAEEATSHTLGLVMTAARAVGNQLHADLFLEEANRHLTEVRTILSSVAEGTVSWNESGIIKYVNSAAGRILRLTPSAIVGHHIDDALPLPPALAEAKEARIELRDVEVTFRIDGIAARCLASIKPIFEGKRFIGYIAMLRPIEQVRRLVHQQIGVQATLSLDDIAATGQSAAMRPVLRQARMSARGTAPLLLRGEGGAGKNHLARAIHNDANPPEAPFLSINCQAIPHELMISEFLGHDDASQSRSRPSKFELAAEGSLLLDNIEHLSLEMQAVLLHLVETGHVMRLGSARPIAVDVRIQATTTVDVEQRVKEGTFIPHLYYRFGVFNIRVPPLRERAEDIPLLAERFLARITAQGIQDVWISDDALAILQRYPWPGNVRELESALERAINHSRDGVIRVGDLPKVVRQGRILSGGELRPKPLLSVAEAEREAIIRAGWACRGRVSEMARHLGIGRTTLWRKMKRLDISREQFKKRTPS